TRFSRDWSSDVCSSDLDLDIDAAVGTLLDQLGPDFSALAPGEGSAVHNGQFVFRLIVGRMGGRRCGKRRDRARDGAKQSTDFHEIGRASCRERAEIGGG